MGLLAKEQHAPGPRDKRKHGSSMELREVLVARGWSGESRAAWGCLRSGERRGHTLGL